MLPMLFAPFMQTAQAYFGTPYITPAHPVAGETVYVNVYQGGHCDLLDGGGNPSYPQITQQESSVRILFLAYRYTDPQDCIFSEGTTTWPIGTFPSGSHILQIDIYYRLGFDPWRTETLGIVPFAVSADPFPEPVPVLDARGVAFLLLMIVGVGTWRLLQRNGGAVIIASAYRRALQRYVCTRTIAPIWGALQAPSL
jgi:hypothetical protein